MPPPTSSNSSSSSSSSSDAAQASAAALDTSSGSSSLLQPPSRRWGQTTLLMAAVLLYALGALWVLVAFTSTRDMTAAVQQAMVAAPVQAATHVLRSHPSPAAAETTTTTTPPILPFAEEEDPDEWDVDEPEPPPRPPGAGTAPKLHDPQSDKPRPEAFARCGDWQEDYMKLHREILAGERPPRYLVAVVSQSGLADQIVGIMTLFFWALLTGRAFQITVGEQPVPPLEAAFDAPYVNWTRPAGDPLVLTEHLYRPYEGKTRGYPTHHPDVEDMSQYTSMYLINKNNTFWSAADLTRLPHKEFNRPYLFAASNRGRVFRLFDNPYHRRTLFNMGLRPETAFACGFRFLFSPNENTRFETGWQLAEERLLPAQYPDDDAEQAAAIAAAENVLRIGIQIRVGDFVFNKPGKANQLKLADYMSYFDCAKEIQNHRRTHATKKVLWYLVSDSQRLKELALERFGPDLLVTSTEPSRHVICAKDGLTDCSEADEMADSLAAAAADMMGLAETDYIVLTRKSGFGKVAAWLNMRWHNVWWLTPGEENRKVCGPRSYVGLEFMADKWSGL